MESTMVQWSAGGIFVLMLINTLVSILKKKNGNCVDEKLLEDISTNISANTVVLQELSFKVKAIYKKLV